MCAHDSIAAAGPRQAVAHSWPRPPRQASTWGHVEDVAPKPEGSGPKAGTARAAPGEYEVQRGAI